MHDKSSILNLITSVKKHSKLYTNLTQNDEGDIKEWMAVAQECGMPIREVQHQWSTLINDYMEYLKNNQDFSLAQHMDFLQPYFFAINNKENIDEIELLNAIGSKNLERKNSAYAECIENEKTDLKFCSGIQKQVKIQVQKTKTQNSTLSTNTECITSASTQNNSVISMSSLELIFLGYAKQLQKMPLAVQLSTKRKIADIMDEAELQMMGL